MTSLLHRLATALILVLAAASATAQQTVDINLVLAVDVSGSVNQTRFELQRRGYADAFRSPAVIEAIAAGANRAIAVAMVQWTGPTLHVLVIDWTMVRDGSSANAFADAVEAAPRQLFGGGTSLSGAIDYSLQLLQKSPFKSERRVIDVSGDGSNNRGRPATDARDEAVKAGAVINGLPILSLEPDLDAYYRDNVIGGAGAFVVSAHSYDDFAEAIRNKLINEIAGSRALDRRIAVIETRRR